MNQFIFTLLAVCSLSILNITPAYAKTPDGKTPAMETQCDILQGKTPGLYGLCVAFCEAQDDWDGSITDDEINTLPTPDLKLLNLYNARRNPDTDPEMPCATKVQELEVACPAWDSDMIDWIKGVAGNIQNTLFFSENNEWLFAPDNFAIQDVRVSSSDDSRANWIAWNSSGTYVLMYTIKGIDADGIPRAINNAMAYDTNTGTGTVDMITESQFEACYQDILNNTLNVSQ